MSHSSRAVTTITHPFTHLSDITRPSSGSVLGQVEHAATHMNDWTKPNKFTGSVYGYLYGGALAGTKLGGAVEAMNGPSDVPTMEQAGQVPSLGDTTQSALQNQLQQEINMRASRTSFGNSGGVGLLDDNEKPVTASHVLLGGN